MNKIKYLLSSVMCISAYSSHAKNTSVLSQLPEGWSVFAKAEGDINGDKQPDYAIILQKDDASLREKRDDGYVLDFNPRRLLVYLSSKDGYQKTLETKDSLLPTQDSREITCLTDPLSDEPLSIKKRQIWLNLNHFMSCGGWEMGNSIYQIRYKNNQFSIIGKETHFIHRATHDETHISTNYLTHKRQIRSGINQDDPIRNKPQEVWETIAKEQIPNTLDISQLTTLFD